ncbi:MAG TPA: DUF1761 domain-containing protein [Patescibacteria group bacterium]
MHVNIWAVLAAAISSMVVGSIWFGPLFGKLFIHEMGMDAWSPEKQAEMKKGMTMMYVWQFIASLVMFYVLAMFIVWAGKAGVSSALQTAFWAWLGFAVPLKLGEALWGGKMTLFWLGIGNTAVTLLVGGAILGLWK